MIPPFSGTDLVRVMRREMEEEHTKARHHLPFESAEDFEQDQGCIERASRRFAGLRRLLGFGVLDSSRTRTG